MQIHLLRALVFLASFLIFQIELILGKILLPGFGGGYLVWGVSVVFYQGVLFLGYLYIHFFNQWFRFSVFRKWQWVLVVGSLLGLSMNVDSLQNPSYQWSMVAEVVWMLATTVGLLFFVLSGISVFSQIQLSTTRLPEKRNPYVLFAASNLGAFASLLGYPMIWEPNFPLADQLFHWQVGYVLLVGLFILVQWLIVSDSSDERPLGAQMTAVPARRMGQWLLLASAPSAMFMAVTNEITFNIAPLPLLWILPLAIYLLTLVLSFMNRPFCPKFLQDRFYLFLSIGLVLLVFKATGNNVIEYGTLMLIQMRSTQYWAVLAVEPCVLLAICFVFCLVCHFRLNQSRPKDPGQLTTYYIVFSAGGFIGGLIVNWVVPLVFNETIELLIAFLIGTAGFMIADSHKDTKRFPTFVLVLAVLLTPIAWVMANRMMGPQAEMLIALGLCGLLFTLLFTLKDNAQGFTQMLAGMIILVPFLDSFSPYQKTLVKTRNYYGVYTVYETQQFRKMKHGSTIHGAQFLDGQRNRVPLTYYHPLSPVGQVLSHPQLPLSRVALVGLGTGSLVGYTKPGDQYDIFELDPLVGEIAREHFNFLQGSPGKIRMVFGDARVSLRKESDDLYDAMIIDVFNSGSIPVHLMTVEALKDYRRVLKPGGILLVHITNQFLELGSILNANAEKLGLRAAVKTTGTFRPPEMEATTWVAIMENPELHRLFLNQWQWEPFPPNTTPAWTDQYSSLWSALLK